MAYSPPSPTSQPAESGGAPSATTGTAWSVIKRVLLGLVGLFILLLLVVVLVVQFLDWNRARPWINEKVSEASGRHFEIKGDLDAGWIWPQPLDTGWRHWVPGVRVQAESLELGNRQGFGSFGALSDADKRDKPPSLVSSSQASAKEPEQAAAENSNNSVDTDAPLMATVGQATATLRLLPLLAHSVLLDTLQLGNPDIALARAESGENNWTFPKKDKDKADESSNAWSVDVAQFTLADGQLAYADAIQKLAVRAKVETRNSANAEKQTADAEPDTQKYGLNISIAGQYHDAAVKGSGMAGQLLSLREDKLQYPVTFTLQAGKTTASATGTLANPRHLSGVDMVVSLASDSMADLYDLTGLVLPNTPAFKTKGHLVGSLEPEHATWDYENFSGAVGESDLEGHLTYTSGKPRPLLKGQIKSRKLQLADLGSVVGTSSGEKSKANSRPGKVLPDNKFATGRWDAMDLDIAFLGQKLIGPSSLPLEDMSVHAVLKEGNLRLDPLRFGLAKGRIDANVVLDGKSDPLKAEIHATVDDLRLSALFPKIDLLDKSLGRMDGAFALRGTGASIAAMLASSNGESRVYIRDGTFSQQLLDLAGLNLGSVLVTKLFGGDREVQLRCAVADLGVKDGIAQTRSVKLSTEESVIEAVGTIDFGHEYMDLRIKPESLDWKFLSLRTPLHVRGPFIKPSVSIEAAPLLARAGAAVIAAVAAPVALALIPITVPAADDDEQCSKLLARADEAVKAGPAGAKAKPSR